MFRQTADVRLLAQLECKLREDRAFVSPVPDARLPVDVCTRTHARMQRPPSERPSGCLCTVSLDRCTVGSAFTSRRQEVTCSFAEVQVGSVPAMRAGL